MVFYFDRFDRSNLYKILILDYVKEVFSFFNITTLEKQEYIAMKATRFKKMRTFPVGSLEWFLATDTKRESLIEAIDWAIQQQAPILTQVMSIAQDIKQGTETTPRLERGKLTGISLVDLIIERTELRLQERNIMKISEAVRVTVRRLRKSNYIVHANPDYYKRLRLYTKGPLENINHVLHPPIKIGDATQRDSTTSANESLAEDGEVMMSEFPLINMADVQPATANTREEQPSPKREKHIVPTEPVVIDLQKMRAAYAENPSHFRESLKTFQYALDVLRKRDANVIDTTDIELRIRRIEATVEVYESIIAETRKVI